MGNRIGWAKTHNHIPRQAALINEGSSDRACSTPQCVADDRIPRLFGDNNAHPIKLGWASIQDEVLGYPFVSATNHLTKIAGLNDAVVAGKHRRKLNGYFAAALTTTGSENRATGTGAHTQTEAVNLRAATVVGLESTLRHLFSSASGRHSQGDQLRTEAQPQKNRAHFGGSQTHRRLVFPISIPQICVP